MLIKLRQHVNGELVAFHFDYDLPTEESYIRDFPHLYTTRCHKVGVYRVTTVKNDEEQYQYQYQAMYLQHMRELEEQIKVEQYHHKNRLQLLELRRKCSQSAIMKKELREACQELQKITNTYLAMLMLIYRIKKKHCQLNPL